MFLDKDEVIDAVGMYYNFDNCTEKQWGEINSIMENKLAEEGIDYFDMGGDDYDTFCRLLDNACARACVPTWDEDE